MAQSLYSEYKSRPLASTTTTTTTSTMRPVMILYAPQDPDNDEIAPIVEQAEAACFGAGVGGHSKPGKAPNINCRRHFYAQLLHDNFWAPTPVYSAAYFKLFFRIPFALFNEILDKVVLHDSDFVQKSDAARKLGLTPHQKICSAVRQLSVPNLDTCKIHCSTGGEWTYRKVEKM